VIAATGLKRLMFGVAALLVASLAAAVLIPLLIPADHIRDAVQAQIRNVTGLDPRLNGETTVSLFPARVSLGQVALSDGREGDAALTAERLIVQLRLPPLLIGRIEIADVTLVRPRITVRFDAGGRSNWSALTDTFARTLNPEAKRPERLSFSEIRIADGTVFIHDEKRGIAETLADVELSLAWPSISRSFGATGRFLWHNEVVDTSLTLSDLFAAVSGDRSGVKLRLGGAPFKLAFDGHLSHRPTLRIEGTLAADTSSLRQALRWSGMRSLPGGGLGPFALRAQTSVAGSSIALSGINLELDGNSAEGVLGISGDGRPVLQGTLAAETLDLTPYMSTFRFLTQDEREWNPGRIALDGLSGFDLDLRLSAAKIALRGAKLGRTGIAANLRNGNLTVTIGESQAFGGVLKGSVGLARSTAGVGLKAQLQFTDVDLENCFGDLFSVRRLEGRGDVELNFEGSGASVLAVTRTLNGLANIKANRGSLAGLNLEQLLRRLERRPLSGGDFRGGRTPFDKLTVALKIAQGTASVDEVQMEGASVKVAVGGSVSIPARDMDLKGTATLVGPSAGERSQFELPFVVQGRWDDPVMLPDAQLLLRRSEAAAPLLDAVRERRGRDAVRSAIDQLTRMPPPGPNLLGTPSAAPTR
jgi:AsmA protein